MKKITILYPFRNRDAQRVKLSLQSLEQQTIKSFEVVFVDYGSDAGFATPVKDVVEGFDFASYQYITHPGLLWNKSKALNYGTRQAQSEFILTADVDILFAPNAIEVFQKLANPETYSLFKVGYLPETLSLKQVEATPFDKRTPKHTGDTFGIGLFPKAALEKVHGLDEFFHFYGSEDEDLNARLQHAGYQLHREDQMLFQHIWHPRYPQKTDKELTVQPRLFNAQRINQQHYLRQKEMQITVALQQEAWGRCYGPEDQNVLFSPDITLRLPNIAAKVDHFLQGELPGYRGKVVLITFFEDSYYNTGKYKVKNMLGKQTQPYISMKEINDAVLKEIIFRYRHYNYSFKVSENRKEIVFIIAL